MKNIEAEYIKDFSCNAILCKAKCCNNNIIGIDAKTLSKYKHAKPPAKSKEIMKKLVKNRIIFKDGACPFWNENSLLCSLREEFNENFAPEKCRTYPYIIANLGEFYARTLTLSCPVACDLIIDKKEAAKIAQNDLSASSLTVKDMKTPKAELLPIFQNYATDILQDKAYSMEERIFLTEKYVIDAENIKSSEELANYSKNFINEKANFINSFKPTDNYKFLKKMISLFSKFYDRGGILTASKTIGMTIFVNVAFELPKITDPNRSYDMENMLKLYEEKFLPVRNRLYKEYDNELSNYAAYLFVSNLTPLFPENLNYDSAVKYFKLLFDFSTFILTSVFCALNAEFDRLTFKNVVSDLSTVWEDSYEAREFLKGNL